MSSGPVTLVVCAMLAAHRVFAFTRARIFSTRTNTMTMTLENCWAEAPIKIARMTLTIKLDGNWSSFQLANSAPPLSVTDSAIAPSARMVELRERIMATLF